MSKVTSTRILAIETSCDETSIAIVDGSGSREAPTFCVLAHTVLSQVMEHQKYGGVYPNLAKRLHNENLIPVLKETLEEADLLLLNSHPPTHDLQYIQKILEREPKLYERFADVVPTIEKPDIGAIAVTVGPGLEPALWVGLNFAKALSVFWNIPLIPVNHMEGHILSTLWRGNDTPIRPVAFPAIALLVSGGHTELILVKDWMDYELLGKTRDDAAGEAFDKVARLLGLPYPGGPEISRLAQYARQSSAYSNVRLKDGTLIDIALPRPMIDSPDFDFSFSGLKTAVRYLVGTLEKDGAVRNSVKAAIAREFEDAVVDVLIAKTRRALERHGALSLIVGGGVIANTRLREAFVTLEKEDVTVHIPNKELTTDNAVMIGIAGYLSMQKENADLPLREIRASGTLSLSQGER